MTKLISKSQIGGSKYKNCKITKLIFKFKLEGSEIQEFQNDKNGLFQNLTKYQDLNSKTFTVLQKIETLGNQNF